MTNFVSTVHQRVFFAVLFGEKDLILDTTLRRIGINYDSDPNLDPTLEISQFEYDKRDPNYYCIVHKRTTI